MTREWRVGDRLANRWEIRRVMKGGMGVVYVVYDHETQEVLAAKTFQDEALARNPRIAPLFRKEALAWVAVEAHPNIARASFVEEIAGKPVLFLEYVSGGDLSGWVGTPRLMDDLAQALRFALSFCDGMVHLRAKGIQAHRDIKPQNCLITEDGVLKITDFGLVKVRGEVETEMRESSAAATDSLTLSRTGRATGTATHMPPEQFRDSKHVGVTADIYSFGVTLFQMLTGILPFSAWTWDEWAEAHIYAAPRIEEIPHEGLQRVVARCLEKHTVHRYQDFGTLRAELAAIYESFTCGPAPVAAVAVPVESDPEHWFHKGVSLASLGMRERAMACYDRALQLDPGQARVMARRGDLLVAMGRREEAVGWYDRALGCEPGLAAAWYGKGAALGDLGLLERALGVAPLLAPAWVSRGVVLEKLGRTEEAARSLHRAVQVHPLLAEGWVAFGDLHRRSGRLEEAQACLKQAVALHAHLPLVWCGRGEVLLALRRWEDASESFQQALELDRLCGAGWLGLGKAFVGWRGHAAEAVHCLGRYLEMDAGSEEAWLYRGMGLAELERWDEAVAAYERAGGGGEVWERKAVALEQMGDVRRAAEAFARATELAPESLGAWLGRAKLAGEMGDAAGALECYERALGVNPYSAEALLGTGAYGDLVRLHPEMAEGWFGLGRLQESAGDFGAALVNYEYAAGLGHRGAEGAAEGCRLALRTEETAEALHQRGSDLLEEARAEEALVYLDKALALEPGRRFALSERAQALGMLGRAEAAVMAYEKAIAVDPEFWVLWYRRGLLLQTPLGGDGEAVVCFERAGALGGTGMGSLIAACRAAMGR